METQPDINFAELSVRLAGYGLRVFAEFSLGGGHGATVPGVGLSIEDFVWHVLSKYAEGALPYDAARGELFSLLARALRNDIIDALRKASHSREETRSPLPRDGGTEGESPTLDELPASNRAIDSQLAEESYRAQFLEAFREEPELAEVVHVVLDLDLSKPREIAAALGISVTEFQNRKKRLRRRLIEYRALEVAKT